MLQGDLVRKQSGGSRDLDRRTHAQQQLEYDEQQKRADMQVCPECLEEQICRLLYMLVVVFKL